MAVLAAIIAKLDEVAEPLRDFYVAKDDKFVLQVNGVKTQADVDAVQRALVNERTEHGKTKAKVTTLGEQVQAWTDAAGEGATPETIKAGMEKLGTLEAAGQPDVLKNMDAVVNDRVNKVVEGRIKSETQKLTRTLETANAKINELTGTVGTFVQKDERRSVVDAVRGAAEAAKCRTDAMGDLLSIAAGELKIVDGKVQTEDGRDPVAWLEDRKKVSPYFWPAAKGAGAGGSDGVGGVDSKDNPFAYANHNVTKIGQLVNSNPAQAAKFAEAAGVPKNPAGVFIWHQRPEAPAK